MYIVAITNTNGCTDYDTVIVNVLPAPVAVITTNRSPNLCPGDSVILTAGNSMFYKWNTSVNDTLNSIKVKTSGAYTVTVRNGVGCVSASASKTVTVHALPNIDAGPNDTTCLSTNFQLHATGGVSYIWSPTASLSDPTIANPMAGPVVSTTYKVIGTDANGCKNVDSVSLQVLSNPSLPTVSVFSSNSLTCSPAYNGYLWYYNGTSLPAETQQNLHITNNGSYYVRVFNSFGCSSVSMPLVISNVGIAESEDNSYLLVYPNPVSQNLTLDISLQNQSVLSIKMINMNGQIVYSEEVNKVGSYRKTINVDQYPAGVYFIEAVTNNGVARQRIIKE
jgi:hypothetical protein